jgi:hypothetical protein
VPKYNNLIDKNGAVKWGGGRGEKLWEGGLLASKRFLNYESYITTYCNMVNT